ncbi:transcriptional regulator [Nostoc calcicola FACHB-389]|uniref:helix-turn-helix domain-containing protein n=1 Tax=Nostoc sp. CCY 9925 TaxID=3103865 RepID=UPI000937C392|nr:helix-turn-helix transcriptional regulator [Nostoc calcicola FACHB-3891]OKH36975.1 transcriptional regulator [Nostoc calcicola FACHB-389]
MVKVVCKLNSIIKTKGISQIRLSEETGIAKTSINRLCQNKFTRVDNHTLEVLGDYFKLASLSELLEYE